VHRECPSAAPGPWRRITGGERVHRGEFNDVGFRSPPLAQGGGQPIYLLDFWSWHPPWAATRPGLLGAEGNDYANSVVHAQFEEPGVVARVGIDLRTKGIAAYDELRSELARFTENAERQIMAE
jgi:ATPase inhibitor subunit zeta